MVGIILTGGQSRRMGRDKAWVDIGGRSCIERVWLACRAACAPVEFQGALPGLAAAFPQTEVWVDTAPAAGPLAALVTALTRHSGGPALLVACDLPFAAPALLRGMAAALAGADWAAPFDGERIHPLCAAYGPGVLPVARALLAAGERSMGALLADGRLTGRRVTLSPAWGPAEQLLLNLNTPDDLERARRTAER